MLPGTTAVVPCSPHRAACITVVPASILGKLHPPPSNNVAQNSILPLLTIEEARVFGCLIEKSQTTPEYYPLTLNALVAACNQKTSREPVVDFTETAVEEALSELRLKGLAASVAGSGRVLRYAHRAGETGLGLSSAQLAILSVALLRGPQTSGELRGRSARQFEFQTLDEAEAVVEALCACGFLEEAPRAPGQKETRYRHCFYRSSAEAAPDDRSVDSPAEQTYRAPTLREEFETLRLEVAALRDMVKMQELRLNSLLTDLGHESIHRDEPEARS